MHDKFWQHTQKNHWGIQRDTALYLCCVSSLKSSRDSSTLVSNQSLTHCSHRAGGLSTRGSSIDQVTLLTQDIRIAFRLRRRHELCLSISQQPTTLYGIVASPASCYNCYLIDTWSTWSWRWLAIAASPLRNGKRIRLRRLKNGVPQRFFLAPLLFNMHLYLWPAKCRLQKVSMHRYWRCWQTVKGVLSRDMAAVGEYLQAWKIRLSTTVQIRCRQLFINEEAKHELKVNCNNQTALLILPTRVAESEIESDS